MKRFTDKKINKLYLECLEWVKKTPPKMFNLKKSWKYQGICNWEYIWVDPRQEMGRTIIHEIIHFLYPDYSETQVLYLESRMINTISFLEMAHLFKIFFQKLHKNEIRKNNQTK